jgi:hypothetical protein
LFTDLWWLILIFCWIVFLAQGIFARGVAALMESRKEERPPKNDKERELLEALRDRGELTPAQAAVETSLTVREADEMLKELAEDGHLEVRVHGGGLSYSLWDYGSGSPILDLGEERRDHPDPRLQDGGAGGGERRRDALRTAIGAGDECHRRCLGPPNEDRLLRASVTDTKRKEAGA